MSEIKIFEVGGHIRDELLGIKSNDIDYSVVAESFEVMEAWIEATHAKVFLKTPEQFTIRALAKSDGEETVTSAAKKNLVRDYVLCRKEGPYSDGRRPDWVEVGTLEDDIMRRDFTVNALARELGSKVVIDLVGGAEDLKNMRLRCVGSAHDRFTEDSLRIIRAIRFIVTKGFEADRDIEEILLSGDFADKLAAVSTNRRREEMYKCMKNHTPQMIRFLGSIHPRYTEAIFSDIAGEKLWLMPTMKDK